jgi:hypothetical protein
MFFLLFQKILASCALIIYQKLHQKNFKKRFMEDKKPLPQVLWQDFKIIIKKY